MGTRAPMNTILYAIPIFGLVVGFPAALQAAPPDERLGAVERDLRAGHEKAERLAREADRLAGDLLAIQRRSVKVAAEVMRREAEIESLEARLRELGGLEEKKKKFLRARRDQYVQVLMAIDRMARHPPEALLVQPLSPGEMVRSAILLRAVVPEIESLTRDLRRDLAELDGAKAEIAERRAALEELFQGLKKERETLGTLQAKKRAARKKVLEGAASEKKRIEKLARDAKSLKELLAKIAAVRKKRKAESETRAGRIGKGAKREPTSPSGKTRALASNTLAAPPATGATKGFPVVGRVAVDYGQRRRGGIKSRGLSLVAKTGAQVVSIGDGRVVFAGSFRGYGRLLIIDHGGDYHSLVAGLGRIDAELGQEVMAGEPVGVMGTSRVGSPTLYFELRREGRPVDPAPWLATNGYEWRG